MFKILFTVSAAMLSGCVSPTGSMTCTTMKSTERIAVCIGLTSVDPTAYSGWRGECPGCDKDAERMFNLFAKRGMEASLYLNSSSTWYNVSRTIYSAAKRLKPNGLLVVAMSSHGGRIRDTNGDEADGYDETMCFWDGAIPDDRMFALIKSLPPTIRLVLVNDSCHSEGNFRSAVRAVQQVVSLGYWGQKKPRTGRAMLRRDAPQTCSILQMAGCSEGAVSFGGSSGGVWTSTLLATEVYFGGMPLSWKDWFELSAVQMPNNQKPVFVEYGPCPFGDQPMLE